MLLQKLKVCCIKLKNVVSGPLQDDSCVGYCDLRKLMPEAKLDKVLRSGERILSPTDACIEYVCIVSAVYSDFYTAGVYQYFFLQDGNKGLRVIVKDCPQIRVCADGKAPYRLPPQCCFGCRKYTSALIIITRADCKNYSFFHHFFLSAEYLSASKFTVSGDDFEGESEDNTTLIELEPEFPTPVPQSWADWSSWTECSRSCGEGRQTRMRECISENQPSLDCSGDRVQIRSCNTHHCPGGY